MTTLRIDVSALLRTENCERCDGEGWLWGHELDEPDYETDQTYDCYCRRNDGEVDS